MSHCCQLLTTVFQAQPGVAIPYIQALGPTLIRFLQVSNQTYLPYMSIWVALCSLIIYILFFVICLIFFLLMLACTLRENEIKTYMITRRHCSGDFSIYLSASSSEGGAESSSNSTGAAWSLGGDPSDGGFDPGSWWITVWVESVAETWWSQEMIEWKKVKQGSLSKGG